MTPFVGRQRELELVLDGYERSKEGRGQAISIISEAGVGKSRLLYEFRKAVTNEDVTFLEGSCLSYSRNVAYYPIVDLLKANFDIQDSDTEQEIREKVTKGLQSIKVDEASALPYLLELLSVKESGIDKIPLSPEARKERTIEAIKKIVLKGSEIRPLIMATEDLHWMDRSSEDVMKELLESIAGARVFLIFTYRPEFVHTWGSRSYHSQVTLNRLSNRETLTMATHILGVPYIERGLEDLILQKTEGIPFFIEEFIKSLKDFDVGCSELIGHGWVQLSGHQLHGSEYLHYRTSFELLLQCFSFVVRQTFLNSGRCTFDQVLGLFVEPGDESASKLRREDSAQHQNLRLRTLWLSSDANLPQLSQR